ncbi:MAG: hypothetical protein KDE26_05070 [Bacteroidetes bacterium]|nr:hypothetical protein [Bacteroidota bacterium]MCB0842623.1 hypothetical protein [Bacteroidota bacterium]
MAKAKNPSPEESRDDSQNLPSNEANTMNEENRTRDKFAEFYEKLLDEELEQAEAEIQVSHNKMEESRDVYEIKEDAWTDAARFLKEYTMIHREIELHLTQRTAEFDGNVTEAKVMRDMVGTNLKNAIVGIKGLSKSLLKVVEKANNLDKILKDTCNQEEYRALNEGVKLKDRMADILKEANQAADAAGDNFSDAVIVSAIHAQLEYESISQMLTDVKTTVAAFETDVLANLKYGDDRDALTRTELDNSIKGLVIANDDHIYAHLHKKGLDTVIDFMDPNNKREANRDMSDIIRENEENFDPLPDPEDPPKKKNHRRKNGDGD